MLRSFQISLLLLLFLMTNFKPFFTPTNQENDLDKIYVYVDRVSDVTGEKAEIFIKDLKDKLQKANITVDFIANNQTQDTASQLAIIYFEPLFNEERVITDYTVGILPISNRLKEISPILKNGLYTWVSLSDVHAIDLVYAAILFAKDRCDLAIPLFEKLIVLEDMAYNLNYNLATCYLLGENYQQSINLYDDQLFTKEGAFLGTNLAWLYLQLGQENEAFKTMDVAISDYKYLDGDPAQLFSARAQLYNLAFRYDDAIADLTTAIEFSSADPALYTLRGQTYLLLYEWDAVLTDYNKALELDPTYADAYYYRGVLYYSILQTGQDMYTTALADFQRYLELAPDGEHADEATRYADDIQTQINALNN